MQSIIGLIAIALYLLATGAAAMHFRKLASARPSSKTPLLALWGGAVLLHGIAIYLRIMTPSGINLAFFHALAMVALLVSAIVWLTAIQRPLENLAFIVLPIAAICLALDQAMPDHFVIAAPADSALQIHILISLLAYSLLSIAALQAMVLAVQERRLHSRRPGGLIRMLPPLQWMEHLLFQLIGAGFVLLTLALITGFVFLEDIFAQHLVHKTILSIIAWILFATLLIGRWRFGWRGRTAIGWTLGGIVALMLAYFGSKLVLELILHRA
ncbi:MAG: cytochrome c biogenesis protein CcsA [Gammaproteobacteria bacterium]|nr:cytochrome c biogenesis protein CcsA [Gammaproteobacteria bacterium]